MHRFEDYTIENVITTSSGHYAIAISFVKRMARGIVPTVSQSFRYEAMWRKAPDYVDTMEAAWLAGREGPLSLRSTWNNLGRLATTLKDWS
jgi:hypothetical protein